VQRTPSICAGGRRRTSRALRCGVHAICTSPLCVSWRPGRQIACPPVLRGGANPSQTLAAAPGIWLAKPRKPAALPPLAFAPPSPRPPPQPPLLVPRRAVAPAPRPSPMLMANKLAIPSMGSTVAHGQQAGHLAHGSAWPTSWPFAAAPDPDGHRRTLRVSSRRWPTVQARSPKRKARSRAALDLARASSCLTARLGPVVLADRSDSSEARTVRGGGWFSPQ
jgi:hypothetical protein